MSIDKYFLLQRRFAALADSDTYKSQQVQMKKYVWTHTVYCQQSDSCEPAATTDIANHIVFLTIEGSGNNIICNKKKAVRKGAAHTHSSMKANTNKGAPSSPCFCWHRKKARVNYADHMLHARPLWLEVAMLLAKWYTGTWKARRKHGNKASREEGEAEVNETWQLVVTSSCIIALRQPFTFQLRKKQKNSVDAGAYV